MKLFSHKKFLVSTLVLILIISLQGCRFITGENKGKLITKNMSTNNEWTDSSKSSYDFNEGDIVEFNYKSDVKNGTLSMKLVDSKENSIYEFNVDKEDHKNIKISKTDTYYIIVSGDGFIGSYEIRLNTA